MSASVLAAWTTWSRAVWRAALKLARSGSAPGTVEIEGESAQHPTAQPWTGFVRHVLQSCQGLEAVVFPDLRTAFPLVGHRVGDPVGVVACRAVAVREVVDAVGGWAVGTA